MAWWRRGEVEWEQNLETVWAGVESEETYWRAARLYLDWARALDLGSRVSASSKVLSPIIRERTLFCSGFSQSLYASSNLPNS